MLFLDQDQPPHQISSESAEKQILRNFATSQFWQVGLVGLKMVIAILNSFYDVLRPRLAPIRAKFHPNSSNTEFLKLCHKFILFGRAVLCFWAKISPHTKFHENQSKNTEFENFCCQSILVGRAGLVGQKMVVAISNSFYVVFGPRLAPIPNFIEIG